ncbi:MAG: MFS transporter, partial [Thermoplasmata archaeon]
IANGSTSLLIILFAKELGASIGQVGLIAAASSLTSVPAYMLWGNLSDKIRRRKPFVILGFVGMALCLLLMGLSKSVPDYFVANLLFGLLSTASAPVATVLVLETSAKQDWPKKIAAFSQIGGIGWVAGLVLGAVWLQLEAAEIPLGDAMRMLFIIGAGLGFLSALNAWRLIQEPKEKIAKKPTHIQEHGFVTIERLKYLPLRLLHFFDFHTYLRRGHRFDRRMLAYLVCIFILLAGFTAFYAIFPIFLVGVVGISSSSVFLIYIAAQLTSALSYRYAGKLVANRGSKRTQLIASGTRALLFPSIVAIAYVGVPLALAFPTILVVHAVIGLCWSLINVSGSIIVSNISSEELRGHAFGAYNAAQGFGSIVGPIVGGLVSQYLGYAFGFLSASGLVVIGILILLRLRV